tara:strand:- start:1106 stop:2008 length:903 start_codon:yes stop_codon:yes gene_type:complete
MVQTTSPAELAYGFGNVYSNVPVQKLARMWRHVEMADQDEGSRFSLKPDHNYLVVDLNRFHLRNMLEAVTEDALQEFAPGGISGQYVPREEVGERYPHHTSDTVLYFFDPKNPSAVPAIELMFGRVKQKDSLTEKITRQNAEHGRVWSERLPYAHHLDVDDTYAATFVCRDKNLAYKVQSSLNESKLLTNVSSRNFIAEPKKSGYRALHDKYVFADDNSEVNGLVLETHIETRKDHLLNKNGNSIPGRDHATYSMNKLRSSEHHQGKNQILIFEKNGRDHDIIVPVNIGNRFAEYTLFNY